MQCTKNFFLTVAPRKPVLNQFWKWQIFKHGFWELSDFVSPICYGTGLEIVNFPRNCFENLLIGGILEGKQTLGQAYQIYLSLYKELVPVRLRYTMVGAGVVVW